MLQCNRICLVRAAESDRIAFEAEGSLPNGG